MICPFTECGGCSLINADPSKVFAEKTSRLAQIIDWDHAAVKMLASPQAGRYRSRTLLRYHPSEGKLGYFAEGSRDLIGINTCAAVTEPLEQFISWVREHQPCTPLKDRYRLLVQDTLDQKVTVHVVGANGITDELAQFRDHLETCSFVAGATAPQSKPLEPFIYDSQDGLVFHFSPNEFRQANGFVNRALRSTINELCADATTVTDLYGGSGNLSLLIAKTRPVEIFELASEAPQSFLKNISANEIEPAQLKYLRTDLSKDPPQLARTVILDPPRRGADQVVVQSLIDQKPTQVLYVSCNPQALKQDLDKLRRFYMIKTAWHFDMMPGTEKIEALVDLRLL